MSIELGQRLVTYSNAKLEIESVLDVIIRTYQTTSTDSKIRIYKVVQKAIYYSSYT
ncbi:hypothetical protein [Flavobacterium sp. ACAM 123]|jgi:hypothetical protein|uniref:hypothetical protein n=1 Tax=Flavobacterium sp. ACAM 123 TaxID=1189620 RepID=UPI0003171C8C|nr:hypothetical protein [Flavobacterium sp. ACAM 123]